MDLVSYFQPRSLFYHCLFSLKICAFSVYAHIKSSLSNGNVTVKVLFSLDAMVNHVIHVIAFH